MKITTEYKIKVLVLEQYGVRFKKNVIRVSYRKWNGVLKQCLYLALEKILHRLGKVKALKARVKSNLLNILEKKHRQCLD